MAGHDEAGRSFRGVKSASSPARCSIGLGRVVAPDLPRPNDGAVTVAETRLAAACDRIELPVSHTGMLFSRRVARQVGAFLRDGRFEHGVAGG